MSKTKNRFLKKKVLKNHCILNPYPGSTFRVLKGKRPQNLFISFITYFLCFGEYPVIYAGILAPGLLIVLSLNFNSASTLKLEFFYCASSGARFVKSAVQVSRISIELLLSWQKVYLVMKSWKRETTASIAALNKISDAVDALHVPHDQVHHRHQGISLIVSNNLSINVDNCINNWNKIIECQNHKICGSKNGFRGSNFCKKENKK